VQKVAKQDDWTRITLRLPPDLHANLVAAAGGLSLNTEIVRRLYVSFSETAVSVAEAKAEFGDERRWMWGIVERAVSGRISPEQIELLQPLFPDRRAQRQGKQSSVSLEQLIEHGRVLLEQGETSPDPETVFAWSVLVAMAAADRVVKDETTT